MVSRVQGWIADAARRVADRLGDSTASAPPAAGSVGPSPPPPATTATLAEFIVHGTPKSFRSDSAKRGGPWQTTIAAASTPVARPTVGYVKLDLTFFFDGATDLDVDNIIKPFADALVGLVYVDDDQIVEVTSRKFDQASLPTLVSPPQQVLHALVPGTDFVLVQVTPALLQEVKFT